jgi:hypothetical protein
VKILYFLLSFFGLLKQVHEEETKAALMTKEERIKALREQVEERRRVIDEHYAKIEREFADQNPEKYRLIVVTEKQGYESKPITATISHYKRSYNTFGYNEEEQLKNTLQYGPYEMIIPTKRTAKVNAEIQAQGIMRPDSYFWHEKTNTYIPAKEIKRVQIEKVEE